MRQLWTSQCLFYQAVSDCCLKWIGILKPPSQNTGGKFILFCIQHKKLSIKLLNIAVKIYCISFIKSKNLNIHSSPHLEVLLCGPEAGLWEKKKKKNYEMLFEMVHQKLRFFYSSTVTQFVDNWQIY